MELLSSTLLRTTVSLTLLLLKPLRPWLAALAALVAALSVAEALMTASLSWLPVVLRLACARPDAWLEMPPRAEEKTPRAEEAWPLKGTPSLRRRTVGVPRSSARSARHFTGVILSGSIVFLTLELHIAIRALHSDDEED